MRPQDRIGVFYESREERTKHAQVMLDRAKKNLDKAERSRWVAGIEFFRRRVATLNNILSEK